MILGSQIVVMFYVYFPEGYTPDKCYMSFDVSGDITENPNQIVYTESVDVNGYTLYGYPCYVNSVQMADEIHVQIYSGGQKSVSETYTAKRYLDSDTTLQIIFDSSVTDIKCDEATITDNIVTILDIPAHELGKFRKITGENNGNTFTVNISPLSYVHSVLKDTTEVVEGITNGVTSLYDYYYRTMRYRDKH